MFSCLVLSLLIQVTLTYGKTISVNNGGSWGDWGPWQRCPSGTLAVGFNLKVERPRGTKEDDTALNGIKLFCAPYGTRDVNNPITSTESQWGEWTQVYWCPSGYLILFGLKVEGLQFGGDDTAANSIKMRCSDNTLIEGNGGPWGSYGYWSGTCSNGICGIRTQVERPQGGGDDTALNDVEFLCC